MNYTLIKIWIFFFANFLSKYFFSYILLILNELILNGDNLLSTLSNNFRIVLAIRLSFACGVYSSDEGCYKIQ